MTSFSTLASCLIFCNTDGIYCFLSKDSPFEFLSQGKDACLQLTYLHLQHVITPGETLLSADALQSEFCLTGSSQSAFTCAIIHIFHFHHLSIDPTSKHVPMSLCGCLAILQPSETNETTKLLLLNLMQDGMF